MDSVASLTNSDAAIPSAQNATPARSARSRSDIAAGAHVALLLFLAIYFARPEDWIPGLSHAPVAKLAGVLVLIALLTSLQRVPRRLSREVLYLGLLIVQLAAASLLSPVWRGGAMQATLAFAKVGLIVLVMAVAVNTAKRLRQVIFIQAASVGVVAAVAVWKHHAMGGRLEGSLGAYYTDPNDLALAMLITLPLCLALLFLSRSKIRKAGWMAVVLTMLYTVFLTGSRGGFLALVAATAVFLWEFAVRGKRHYLLAVALIAGVILFQFSSGTLMGRLRSTLDDGADRAEAYDSAQIRQHLLWRSVELTMQHPLFGVGPGNFPELANWYVTHNSFTQMSAEGGIPAIVLYVLILWYGFKNLRRTKQLARGQGESRLWARALLASLIAYCVGSTFLSAAFEYFPYILVAYTTALFAIARKTAAQAGQLEFSPIARQEVNFSMDVPAS